MKRIILLVTACLLLFSGCSLGEKSEKKEFFAMDTYMTMTAYGDNAEKALEQAEKRINELDKELSTGDENSEISKLNSSGRGTLSADCAYLMEKSLELNKSTDGAFNPVLYPLTKAWGFADKEYNV
ncbi:MAG: FAD:protein FMN transferase, partial [Oscillospiraceae bacterium]